MNEADGERCGRAVEVAIGRFDEGGVGTVVVAIGEVGQLLEIADGVDAENGS